MTRTPSLARPQPGTELGPRSTYGELPRLAGRTFMPLAFAARLPFSMLTIGTLMLVSSTTGSVAVGGLASAASALGTAAGGPVQGALADRLGQRRVLLLVITLAVGSVLALVAAAVGDAPTPLLLAAAVATGASIPQVGPLARVRWIALTRHNPRALGAAMSYEGMADEVSFVLGPALVGVLSTVASPQAAMLLAAAGIAVFGTGFALHPTARAVPPIDPTTPRAHGGVGALLRAEAIPTLGMIAMGVLFGGTQTAVTTFAADLGIADSAGLIYAVMSIGSAITALAVAMLPAHWPQRSRWIAFATGLTLSATAMIAVAERGSPGTLVMGLSAMGLFVGPVMVTVFTVAGDRAPSGRVAAAMTVVSSGTVIGIALGASVGGRIAQDIGASAAFALPAGAAVALVVFGLCLRRPRPAQA